MVIRLSHDAANSTILRSSELSSRAVQTVIGGAIMPQYYFTIRSGDHEDEDERCVVLQDVAAALDCACGIVRELSANKCNDPGLTVSVSNEKREMVLSVPFLAACA
jgi:hypothetical protein